MAIAQPVIGPATGIEAFLERERDKELLRLTTAGSVDDGKSTLIGRLLHDSKGVYEDQLASVKRSAVNRASGPIDFSLITDGLKAEREQGITIDVAYRYFATARRKFIIADTPGHEQYTRNMATGASTADLAVVLIDARQGVLPQSRRHAYIASLLCIPRVVVAVNKMDLVDFRRDVFDRIRAEFGEHLGKLDFEYAHFIPLSALEGDNVVTRSERTPWYGGESLLEHLETVPLAARKSREMRFPVQYVIRPDHTFRGYAGQLVSGTLRPGDPVMVLPSGRTTRVKSLPSYDGDLEQSVAPMSITVCLEDELDISRGDMLVNPLHLPHVSRHLKAKVVWMHAQPLRSDQRYLLKHTSQQVTAIVTSIRYRVDVNTLAQQQAGQLELNEIGAVSIETHRPLFFDSYRRNRATGAFILIDPITNATVGAGMIEDQAEEEPALTRARAALQQLEFSASPVAPAELFARSGHYPATVCLTGRQELAYLLQRRLFDRGCHVHVVADQVESRILPEVAQLLNAAGLIAILSVSGAHSAERGRARSLVGEGRFFDFGPGLLDAADERAAVQVITALEDQGIIRKDERFAEGEGI